MAKDLPEAAHKFVDRFGSVEHALRKTGIVKKQGRAEADWAQLASNLGDEFFEEVRGSGRAATLIAGRPRKQMTEGLKWIPEKPVPITCVQELIVNGVCQVRNHIIHRQKFHGSEEDIKRDMALIADAQWILELILAKNPKLRENL